MNLYQFVTESKVYAALGAKVLPLHGIRQDKNCTCGNPKCNSPGKHPLVTRGKDEATTNVETIETWGAKYCGDNELVGNVNIGLKTGSDSCFPECPAGFFVLDIDPKNNGHESLEAFEAEHGKLPTTMTALSGLHKDGRRGIHHCFKMPKGIDIRNRVDVLPGIDVRANGGYIVVGPSTHVSGVNYEWTKSIHERELIADAPDSLLNLILGSKERQRTTSSSGSQSSSAEFTEGSRNDKIFRLAAGLRAKGFTDDAIRAAIIIENETRCKPPLDDGEVERIIASALRYAIAPQKRSWPDPISDKALHGLAGEIVRTIDPHTESDPIAILLQFLTAYGNITGRGAYYQVEADKHYTNLFIVLVGQSAKARKGTSLGHIVRLMELVDSDWSEKRQVKGLSTGEGVIFHVRDPSEKRVKKKGQAEESVVVDPGEKDKRLFVTEPEYASVLKVSQRKENTLSATLRNAWDTGKLKTLTKNSPTTATGAHISIVGHITTTELRRELSLTESANGFGNRHLFACVRRSKLLPEGGHIEKVNLRPILKKLKAAVAVGRNRIQVRKNKEATQLWAEVYPQLSEGKPGLFGAVTGRAEAQVIRLATIYALLDRSYFICRDHLEAGLALWNYLEQSCEVIFWDAMGDPLADEIFAALTQSPNGLTRTEIRDLFSRNGDATKIQLALDSLQQRGLARFEIPKGQGAGRPTEKWFAVQGRAQ